MTWSERLRGFISGAAQANPIMTAVLAASVTAMIAIPLAVRAANHVPTTAIASTEHLVVNDGGFASDPLHGAIVEGRVQISWLDPEAAAVAFSLAPVGGEVIVSRVDGAGPRFDFLTDSLDKPIDLDTAKLSDGDYELLVAVTDRDGNHSASAAQFMVTNR